MQDDPPQNFIRLGYSSISAKRIEPGVRKLAALIHDMI
jgi:GntR family transcriptional regulator/MocR family aminotransferase